PGGPGRGDHHRQGGPSGGEAGSATEETCSKGPGNGAGDMDEPRLRRATPGVREILRVRLLLDTHAFLWWARGDSRLSPRSRGAIRSSRNDVYFSVASGWEIIVKEGRGRLDLPEPARTLIPRLLSQNEFVDLPVH